MAILLTVLATVALTVLALNFVTGEKKIDYRLRPLYAVSEPQFLRSMGSLLGPAMSGRKPRDRPLERRRDIPGDARAIRSARKTITFETYIYWSGRVGKEFAGALSPSARVRGSRSTSCWTGSAAPAWTRTS